MAVGLFLAAVAMADGTARVMGMVFASGRFPCGADIGYRSVNHTEPVQAGRGRSLGRQPPQGLGLAPPVPGVVTARGA
jgi:hypothetical protein